MDQAVIAGLALTLTWSITFDHPCFTNKQITTSQKIEVNQEKMIRKLVDVVTFTLYPQPSTTHTHIHWNSEQPKIWSNSNKKMCATNLVLDSLHFFGFPPSVYFCLLQSTLNLFHLKYVSFFNSPSLIREAIPREKCSFFELCSKGLWPPPPLFEHLSYFAGAVFLTMFF